MEKFERLLNEEITPTSGLLEKTIGKKIFLLWVRLREYLNQAYDIEPDLIYYGKKYGWCYRYRKSSKTLCTLFPEKDSFTVLITLGRKELEKLEPLFETLSQKTEDLIKSTRLYHDGKWLWIRSPTIDNLQDLKTLLQVKRKPKLI